MLRGRFSNHSEFSWFKEFELFKRLAKVFFVPIVPRLARLPKLARESAELRGWDDRLVVEPRRLELEELNSEEREATLGVKLWPCVGAEDPNPRAFTLSREELSVCPNCKDAGVGSDKVCC